MLELLIALMVVVLLAGLVAPACTGWVGEHRFREHLATIEATMSLWRGRAQRDGHPLIVSLRVSPNGVDLVATSPSETDLDDTRLSEKSPLPRLLASFPGLHSGAEQDGSTKTERTTAPQVPIPESGESNDGELICLLLPDGSAAGPRLIAITDASGREAHGRVDKWSGEIAWTRSVRAAARGKDLRSDREPPKLEKESYP